MDAVTYIYSSDGFWKPLKNLNYAYNKYSAGVGTHVLDSAKFDALLTKGQYLTCRDTEGHLIGDLDFNGELDAYIRNGYAFHTHNAKTDSNVDHSTIKPEYILRW